MAWRSSSLSFISFSSCGALILNLGLYRGQGQGQGQALWAGPAKIVVGWTRGIQGNLR